MDIGKIDGRESSGTKEFIQERHRKGVDHAVRSTIERQSLLVICSVPSMSRTIRVLAPIAVDNLNTPLL